MDSVLRGAATYVFVWMIFRIAGKRTLAEITTFDAILLLIVSETTDSALVVENSSFTNTVLLILTLLGLDVVFSCLMVRFPKFDQLMNSTPLVIFDGNGLKRDVMRRERVNENEILNAARQNHGLTSLNEVRYAILETTGDISIVPK
jgi:uncharacterized membrane protein YcaP (DUF421 family)